MKKGKFIVLEGIDGAGISTQAIKLAEHIQELSKYNDVLLTHEPWRSEKIKEKLTKDKDAYSDSYEMAKLFIEDRIEHVDKLIKPNLERGVYIISDRYRMSTDAYQSTQGLELSEIMNLQDEANLLTADLTFFVNTSLNESINRLNKRGDKKEKFEDVKFLKKLINQYENCYNLGINNKELYGDIKLINGNNSIKEVSIDISYDFNKHFSNYQNI